MIPATGIPSFPPVFGIWMSDGNQLPPAGETACPTYFAKRLIQQGGAGGFACRSHGHNQWSASKMNKFPKAVNKHPAQCYFSCTPWGGPLGCCRPSAGIHREPSEI